MVAMIAASAAHGPEWHGLERQASKENATLLSMAAGVNPLALICVWPIWLLCIRVATVVVGRRDEGTCPNHSVAPLCFFLARSRAVALVHSFGCCCCSFFFLIWPFLFLLLRLLLLCMQTESRLLLVLALGCPCDVFESKSSLQPWWQQASCMQTGFPAVTFITRPSCSSIHLRQQTAGHRAQTPSSGRQMERPARLSQFCSRRVCVFTLCLPRESKTTPESRLAAGNKRTST